MAIDATVGGADANCYLTIADAAGYVTNWINATAWIEATVTMHGRALVMATFRLEQEGYVGTKTTTSQALKWPRIGTYDEDGNMYASDAIPEIIKKAACLLALAFLHNEHLLEDTGQEGFISAGVGSGAAKAVFRGSWKAGQLPQMVKRQLLRGRVWLGSSGITGRVDRG